MLRCFAILIGLVLATQVQAQNIPDACRRVAEKAGQNPGVAVTNRPRVHISGSVAAGLSHRSGPGRRGVVFGSERDIQRLVPSDPRYRAALRACLRARGIRSGR